MDLRHACVVYLVVCLTIAEANGEEKGCDQVPTSQCVEGPGVKELNGQIQCADNGSCVCINGYTATASACKPAKPTVYVYQDTLTVEKGTYLRLTCGLPYPADAQIKYEWTKDESKLMEAQKREYSIQAAKKDNSGTYKCQIISGDDGKVKSEKSQVLKLTVSDGVAQVMGSVVLTLMAVCISTFL